MYILLFSIILTIIIIITIIIICIIIALFHILYPLDIKFSNINTECKYRRFGCCDDKITPKLDFMGSNCRGF